MILTIFAIRHKAGNSALLRILNSSCKKYICCWLAMLTKYVLQQKYLFLSSQTTKERNMWSCRFDGKPIEFSIMLINPNPGKSFQLGSAKVWNWNNKISVSLLCLHNRKVGKPNRLMAFPLCLTFAACTFG